MQAVTEAKLPSKCYPQLIRKCQERTRADHKNLMNFIDDSESSPENFINIHTGHENLVNFVLGLSMELFLDQKNYLGAGLSPQAGARVVVHNVGHHPLPEENGITVAPHLETSIALLEASIKSSGRDLKQWVPSLKEPQA